tara:strand:+ start:249 stop:710 length:462 start_codon:yes stop_codon:yes gene_type:complete
MIKITYDNFDLEKEFKKVSSNINGAYSFFLGTVRSDLSSSNKKIKGIFLECYEELAIAQLENIRTQALYKWNLNECLIIHRIGKLDLGEKIVLIITSSSHRSNSIEACEYVIDNLKIDVAIWKFHLLDNEEKEIVHQKNKDNKKMLKWREIIN